MQKINYYTYLGTNGILNTPIHLEGIYSVKKIELIADTEKFLTNDGGKTCVKSVIVLPEEVENWKEIDLIGQD